MHRIIFSPEAEDDLKAIMRHIAKDSPAAGLNFTGSIRTYCESLDLFPQRGTDRSDIRPSLRTVGFERRATIAFEVAGEQVTILRIFYGGRDTDKLLREAFQHTADDASEF